ncbi:MAG: hypothetical protein EAX81_07185 [Candidatus Thorarchaeota archaeon]|nr:hypothetical protein [Candidatus Thorarchaeota archaeon]
MSKPVKSLLPTFALMKNIVTGQEVVGYLEGDCYSFSLFRIDLLCVTKVVIGVRTQEDANETIHLSQ